MSTWNASKPSERAKETAKVVNFLHLLNKNGHGGGLEPLHLPRICKGHMANAEEFDESELAEGFDEEVVDDDLEVVAEVDDEIDGEGETDDIAAEDIDKVAEVPLTPAAAAVPDEDDDVDDADVELALDEVLAETIMRTTVVEDDEEAPIEVDPNADPTEQIIPKQDDEFRCSSCRLLKKQSQLADKKRQLCRDCV